MNANKEIRSKLTLLQDMIRSYKSAIIAFSGGVDSSTLLSLAHEFLGGSALAVTVSSALHGAEEKKSAKFIARLIGAKSLVIDVDVLSIETIRSNPVHRCYLCKKVIFGKLLEMAKINKIPHVLDGTNADDDAADRPGFRALKELGIRSPLRDVGLTKQDIRQIARSRGLPNWNAPALPCLATRIPFGEELTSERLRRIEEAEKFLHGLGFANVRVRDHRTIARIELPTPQFESFMKVERAVTVQLKLLGYTFVTLDLDGFQSGTFARLAK